VSEFDLLCFLWNLPCNALRLAIRIPPRRRRRQLIIEAFINSHKAKRSLPSSPSLGIASHPGGAVGGGGGGLKRKLGICVSQSIC